MRLQLCFIQPDKKVDRFFSFSLFATVTVVAAAVACTCVAVVVSGAVSFVDAQD